MHFEVPQARVVLNGDGERLRLDWQRDDRKTVAIFQVEEADEEKEAVKTATLQQILYPENSQNILTHEPRVSEVPNALIAILHGSGIELRNPPDWEAETNLDQPHDRGRY